MTAERVTPENAQKAAKTFLNNNGAKSAQLTDLSKAAGFANLYIFAANPGFVVIAADDCVQPILGYSLTQSPIQPTASFNADDMPDNVRGWLQGYSDEIQAAINSKAKATAETAKQWKDLIDGNSKAGRATTEVEPLIQTKWNQNKYYNDLCPIAAGGPNGHAFTGCVATAMAQIMKHWNYPSYGIGSHSYTWNEQTLSANFGETTYDWNNMADYYEYYYVNGTDPYSQGLPEPSEVEISAVATLMYHCGVSVDMNYGGGGSGASSANVATALKSYFNYSPAIEYIRKNGPSISYTDDQWIAMVKAELNAYRPLLYSGQDPDPEGSGHSFVCDGYDNSNNFHFNWGWAGHWDGYFSLSNLNTGANSGDAGAGNGNYTRDQSAIFGIEPVQCAADNPTNLVCTMTESNIANLSWIAASDAASYNIYRNGNFAGNSTTTTFTETLSSGSHTYYVRSVDVNGNLSLSSNIVTATVGYQQPIVNDLSASLSGDNAVLNWTAPQWCYPETHSAMVTYGNETIKSYSGSKLWGHRYLASNLQQYVGKAVYKVSFHVRYPGSYTVYVYSGTTSSGYPQQQMSSAAITTTAAGWNEVSFSTPVIIDETNDIWVIINDPENGETINDQMRYNASSCEFTEHRYGFYYGSSLPYIWQNTDSNYPRAYLIRTYLTDGIYTYNLYDNNTPVASNVSGTTYEVANPATNTSHFYTLKTNYYAGETEASNKAGLALGTASLSNLQMAANDQMTISEGSTLTVSGTMSNDNAANLIIEDGAQLVHYSEGVNATLKKRIASYTAENEGWHFIASPLTQSITPSTGNGLLSGNNYDLYYYDEPTHYWRNHKNQQFNLAPSKGYLYANEGKQVGVADDVSYSFDDGFQGWTLIDTDGDGYNWKSNNTDAYLGEGCLASDSWWNNNVLEPDNYVVSPKFTFTSSSSISFWAAAQAFDYEEHFGVAVSTTDNTDATSFTTLAEWTMPDANTWHQYTVDLSQYAGQEGYVAIRHFNCFNQWTLRMDEVELKEVLTEGHSFVMEDVVLSFAGEVRGSSASVNVPLSYASQYAKLKGFNLVGNPFTCNATVSQGFYVLNPAGSEVVLAETGRQIAPCEGIMVQATADNNYSVTFTKANGAKGDSNGQSLDLIVKQDKTVIDRARMRLGEGLGMEKFSLENKAQTSLVFRHDGKDLAVAYANGLNELPLHFKAIEDGIYTIAIETNTLDMDYLHLIDNMTGADIDLFSMSTYTFTAKTTDYPSRFRLVFVPNSENTVSNSEEFAYISNGEIVIIADAGTASLQVVDMMGRVLVCRDASNASAISTTGIPAGVYVLRLIDGENVRTQKIVIG